MKTEFYSEDIIMKVQCSECKKEWNSNAKADNVESGKINCKSCGGLAVLIDEPKNDLQAELEAALGLPKSIDRTLLINEIRAKM